jgi:hypothetical protein
MYLVQLISLSHASAWTTFSLLPTLTCIARNSVLSRLGWAPQSLVLSPPCQWDFPTFTDGLGKLEGHRRLSNPLETTSEKTNYFIHPP